MTTRCVLYLVRADERFYDLIRSVAPPDYDILFLETDDPAERADKLAQAEMIIVGGLPLSEADVTAANRLRVVIHQGVGYHDTVATEALRDRQVALAITPGGPSEGVAEHALMMMLAAGRRLPAQDRALRDGVWTSNTYRSVARGLKGSRVGIIGLGRIGRQVAKRLSPFETETVYHDIADIPGDVEASLKVTRTDLDGLLRTSDFVTLHVPLTDLTKHLIDETALSAMKPGAILINCARGPVVSEDALLEALRSGHLGGAALDVFEIEPVAGPSPFRNFDNVVLTPHNAPGTRDVMIGKFRDVFDNADRFFRGETMIDKVEL